VLLAKLLMRGEDWAKLDLAFDILSSFALEMIRTLLLELLGCLPRQVANLVLNNRLLKTQEQIRRKGLQS
jgi:hypothetical protein